MGHDRVDAREPDGRGQVEGDDACVGMRAAQCVAPEHPGRGQVTRVLELARDFGHRVLTEQPLSDPADGERRALGGDAHARSAAIRTASKIFA